MFVGLEVNSYQKHRTRRDDLCQLQIVANLTSLSVNKMSETFN